MSHSLVSASMSIGGSNLATASSTLADLTAVCRRTNGDRPPPLVGCSLSLVGDKIFVFGGRLVPTRTMVNSIYSLSLETLTWKLEWPLPATSPTTPTAFSSTAKSGPVPRYFHSAEVWNQKIVIAFGEGYSITSGQPGEDVQTLPLRTLDDIWVYDTLTNTWEQPEISCASGVEKPEARYAHLSTILTTEHDEGQEESVLLIMGGQDVKNTYVHSMNVLDLQKMSWVKSSLWDRHIGTYRAVATTAKWSVHSAPESAENLARLSFSSKPSLAEPEPILLFSNFNFTQVRRDLDAITAPTAPKYPLEPTSLSSLMTGTTLPPGLRFPTGTIIGNYLIVFGTFLSHATNNFSIWALNLKKTRSGELGKHKLEWEPIEAGKLLNSGSWNRGIGYKNSIIVLGDRERDIAVDYDHRQTNFTHFAQIDLEAFGIYQPPQQSLPESAQSLGLLSLAQAHLGDFEIICLDGIRLKCSRTVLESRWNWFHVNSEEFRERAQSVRNVQQKRLHAKQVNELNSSTDSSLIESLNENSVAGSNLTNDAKLNAQTLDLPENSQVVQAFLEYLYTLNLCTPLQLQLPILISLLHFASTYNEQNLRALVVHALHGTLTRQQNSAAIIYEAASLTACTALQLRSLRILMAGPKPAGANNSSEAHIAATSTNQNKSIRT